ncbi:MAG: Aspartate aminotransferase [Verrucomicrobia subdivision 3 bacterium]|nr:Aspartate aminotransferase [Limisphaerales bacterium]MCS1416642.1 Aspartate aminotransferase [Limisphaerales bacterium]
MSLAANTPDPSLGLRQSRRMEGVQDPVIPTVGELSKANPGTISLGQGVVSYAPPASIHEKLEAFEKHPDNHKYKLVQGIPELLSAIQIKLREENQIDVNTTDQVVVTAGSNMGFHNAILAIADPGDEILLPSPFYFNHEMAIDMASCIVKVVPTGSNHQLDLSAIESRTTARMRAIVTISPNNPSGAVYPPETLKAVNVLCRERGIYHISDEAYEYFTYEGARHFSPGSLAGASATW